MDEILELQKEIVRVLKNVYDPEIPVNIFDLGLIYRIDVDEKYNVEIDMTLTAPNCPMADELLADVNMSVLALEKVNALDLKLVFEPPWTKEMLSEEARLELDM